MKLRSLMGNPFGCSASGERLVSAARDGDLQEAKALLECNPRLIRYSTFGVRNSPLHYSAARGHHELLLDLGASVTAVTVEDGSTVYLIGARSTALHYAACGGNAQCCQMLICKGADLTTENANGWNPLLVARLWHRHWLEEVLSKQPEHRPCSNPSPYLSLPLMSVIRIARECRRRNPGHLSTSVDPCSVCLERKCLVAAEGCRHELCSRCALYLCCTSNTVTSSGPPGSIPCPFCRHAIVSFMKLPDMNPIKDSGKPILSLAFCTTSTGEPVEPDSMLSKS